MNLALHRIVLALSLAGLSGHTLTAQAQSSAVEGELREITLTAGSLPAPTGILIDCSGVKFRLNAQTRITSPTATLTLAQFNSDVEFPSAPYMIGSTVTRKGFRGGTCIVNGSVVPNADLTMNATDVFVEMAENVLVGPLFANGTVMGVPVKQIADDRMPTAKKAAGLFTANLTHPGTTEMIRNQFGFGVSTVPPGDLIAAEGYRGVDGALYAHTIESTGGSVIEPATPRPSIQRAQCQNSPGNVLRDSIEVRGGCILPGNTASSTIRLFGITPAGTQQEYLPSPICTRTVAPAGTNPGMGSYRYAISRFNLSGDACPTEIVARQVVGGIVRGIDVVTPDER